MKLDALEEYCEERAISRGLDHDARAIVEKALRISRRFRRRPRWPCSLVCVVFFAQSCWGR